MTFYKRFLTMRKQIIIAVFLSCLTISYCRAQSDDDVTPDTSPVKKSGDKTITPSKPVAVTFIANKDCLLSINGNGYEKISKDNPKTIKLPAGSHRLLFENAETGRAIKNFSFALNKNTARNGTYTYRVQFK